MRVVICAMAKNEHDYINDWVKWHLGLGFDMIYLFDNDDLKSKYIGNFIEKQYQNKVKIINIRGQHCQGLQHIVYTDFYQDHIFDWCAFFDVDEFLFGVENIKSFLRKDIYKDTQQIRIKWKLFGDDDLIRRDMTKPVYEVFKKEVKETRKMNSDEPYFMEDFGKTIVRGGNPRINFRSAHVASYGKKENIAPSVLPSGKQCLSTHQIKEDYSEETVYLHHYITKSLSEFIKQKMNRTDAIFEKRILGLSYYWRVNKQTKEKQEYINKNMGHK